MLARCTSRVLLRTQRVTLLPTSAMCLAPLRTLARFESSSSGVPPVDVSTRINDMMDSFGEARALINDAVESAGTTYFGDDFEDAERETKRTLQLWSELQSFLKDKGDEATLSSLVKENQLKMKQLAQELEVARDAGGD